MKSFLERTRRTFGTPPPSSEPSTPPHTQFECTTTAAQKPAPAPAPTPAPPTKSTLFPVVDPGVDGDECLQDCAGCPIQYPRVFTKIGIEEDSDLWGGIKEYAVHAIVATGKTDWIRDVCDEKGSVMEALDKHVGSSGSDEKQEKMMAAGVRVSLSFYFVTRFYPYFPSEPFESPVIFFVSWKKGTGSN